MRTIVRAAALSLACAGALTGCATDGAGSPKDVSRQDTPPAYADVARVYNERVDGLDRVWARSVVRVEGEDAEGKRLREQAEGHVQIVRPRRLAISMGKVGHTYLHLGSDEDRYWWLDALDDDNRVGLVGRNDEASPEKSAALGVPVHPLDLIELMGITELPPGERKTGWSKDGSLVVFTVPARWGFRWVWVDPESFEPRKIALTDDDLNILAEAELSHYQIVRIEGDATRRPMMATRVKVRVPGFDGFVRITMTDPRNRSISPRVFDLDTLVSRYNIDEVIDVDDPELWAEAQAPSRTPGG